MPAFNLDDERRRIQEPGLSLVAKRDSARDSLRTYLSERTGAPSFFELYAEPEQVTFTGYEQRGDLDNSYKKSVESATVDVVAERYRLENAGYGEVKKRFFDVPLHSTIMLASPSPDEPIPGYPGHNMMYFYHVTPSEDGDTKKRTIKSLAWVNNFTKDEQAQVLNMLGPQEPVVPSEESILLSPVTTYAGKPDTDSFRMLWEQIGEVYEKAEQKKKFKYPSFHVMERYLLHGKDVWENKHQELSRMTKNIAQRLIDGESDEELAKDWDIMLNLADKELLHEDITTQLPREPLPLTGDGDEDDDEIFGRYSHLSYRPRATNTSCGVSAGLGDYTPETRTAGIITGTFTVTGEGSGGEKKLKCKKCPLCEAPDIVATIADGRITCPKCNKSAPYAC